VSLDQISRQICLLPTKELYTSLRIFAKE